MINFAKYCLLTVGMVSVSMGVAQAEFKQDILDSAMKMAEADYKIDANPVNKAVQAANFLAHDLKRESDPTRAKNIADTLLGLVSKGEGKGVGGISETPANEGERGLMINALQEATRFLKEQDGLTEAALGANLKTFDKADKEHEKQHVAHVSAIIFGAFKKHAGVLDSAAIKSDLQGILAGTAWLKDYMTKDEYWKYVDAYLSKALERRVYNVKIQQEIDDLRAKEKKDDGEADYNHNDFVKSYVASLVQGDNPLKDLETLTEKLQETVIPEKAFQIARSMIEKLKTKDFNFERLLADSEGMPTVIDALIAIEKYRMLETRQSYLEKIDPPIFTYQNTKQSPESEAVLLAMVSAIQSILRNPDLTDDEVVDQFKYKIPKSPYKAVAKGGITWSIELEERRGEDFKRPSYEKALEMIRGGAIKNLISKLNLPQKVKDLSRPLNISKVQKLEIDKEAMKQKLFYVHRPVFDFKKAVFVREPRIMYWVQSRGNGECGYFSLRHAQGYAEYVQQILDNLDDPEIYNRAITLTNLNEVVLLEAQKLEKSSAEKRSLQENEQLEKLGPYLKALEELQVKYEAESSKIERVPNPTKAEFDVMIATARDELETKIKRLQAEKEALKKKYNDLKHPHLVEIVKIVDPNHLRLIKQLIHDIDFITTQDGGNRGWYTNTATDYWTLQPLQPDLISVILNGYDVYSWVPISAKRGRPSIVEDGQTALIGFTSPRKEFPALHPRRIHLYNQTGGTHYDKWVEAGDYADMAAALRHKHKHSLGDTNVRLKKSAK
ncbi:hypothetical protein [Candidatus Finniella inopinata]|uniref:Uncharacterized protein n=1 Tax=Candidatus Finniella inopinata TaxID=1696036 RepID=A0A4Q7DJN1_9PROT|nr:hypothetical protein [Candidatus Finniella inopinata]RZI46469.1 hypothetical protein EQU50_02475 [Candidatus Finniella inopinata]